MFQWSWDARRRTVQGKAMGDWELGGRKATCQLRFDDGGVGWYVEGTLELDHGTLTTQYNFTNHEPMARYEHVIGSVSIEPIFHFRSRRTQLEVTKRLRNAELATKIDFTDMAGKLEYSRSGNHSGWSVSLPFEYGTVPSQVDVGLSATRTFKFRRTHPVEADAPPVDTEY